ncbi:BREX-1 system adenine-specific DNA-methyltransferase PglX [Pseudomonas alliivorans]|nr:BREX-1 system adenine-specific DNA-methyltransferase PglX [Pseudomonas alliivorans]
MNRSALKKYAPQARLDFIEAVTLRARRLGLDPAVPVNIEQTGDVLLIGGQPFPATIDKQRDMLARRIQQQGFSAVVEALAYTWFNRLVAIRFMELKGYLGHGYRVLSHPQGQQPEILDHVQHLELTGLDKAQIIRLKTAGNQDEALYREILLGQCHELHRNMPFLFEALDDATELLLPDNLLRTDSPIARLVNGIEEDDWKEVEVIGWLYQFYISEKKEEVIGKVVKSEDIPAATQLFTPNWIVQYLVQNSLGRLWLMANPGSRLKEKMLYYIEPAEQAPEVQAQLDALIKVRMDEDGGTLNPESLTVLDPACGSGHILVEAYNLLRAIYEERGYRLRDIPRLILQKNLFGLDIDDRAAQLAGFALLMKAREDDRRLFDEQGNPPHLNVMAIQQSVGLPDEEMARVILNAGIQIEGGDAFHSGQLFGGGQLETQHSSGLTVLDIRQLIKLFENGKTFGSLISVPDVLKANLSKIVDLLATVRSQGDNLSRSYAKQVLEDFAWPASLLALQYDTVVANPPYMGGKGMNPTLKNYAKVTHPECKSDLFAMFIERGFEWCKDNAFNAMVTMQSWMFLSSYDRMRTTLLEKRVLSCLMHMENGVMGIAFGTSASVFMRGYVHGYSGSFSHCENDDISEQGVPISFPFKNSRLKNTKPDEFKKIPGSPIAYWVSEKVRSTFVGSTLFGDVAHPRQGMATTNNDRFLRRWYEVSSKNTSYSSESIEDTNVCGKRWYPYNKGGSLRRWYGNNEFLVNFKNSGEDVCRYIDSTPGAKVGSNGRVINKDKYFLECITWSDITTSGFAARYCPPGFIFDVKGSCGFPEKNILKVILGLLSSKLSDMYMGILNPTSTFQVGDIARIPFLSNSFSNDLRLEIERLVDLAISYAKSDWDSSEISWGFSRLPVICCDGDGSIESSIEQHFIKQEREAKSLREVEEAINGHFITAYGLEGEISPEVPESKSQAISVDREKAVSNLISYSIGCMFGRYSLDEPGLIYADSASFDFNPLRYQSYPADADGIIPITDESWFEDDAAERVREFTTAVWGAEKLVENMEWLADSLGRKPGESADDAIRRYLSSNFYKYHLQTYKKRPIYWLFSSGKQKAFECLVYLHRYNEGTLSRMRMEYVVPLQSRMQARIDKLADDINSATGSAQQKTLQKRKDKFTKQLEELRRFDETLRPYADQRIALNLDDGVKVNYGKFGDLLAEVKAITGGKED